MKAKTKKCAMRVTAVILIAAFAAAGLAGCGKKDIALPKVKLSSLTGTSAKSLVKNARDDLSDFVDENISINVHGTETRDEVYGKATYGYSYKSSTALQQVGQYALLEGTNAVIDSGVSYKDTVKSYFLPTTKDNQTMNYMNYKGLWEQYTTTTPLSEKEFLSTILDPSIYSDFGQNTSSDSDSIAVTGLLNAKKAIPILSHSMSLSDFFIRATYISDALNEKQYSFTMLFDKESQKLKKITITASDADKTSKDADSVIDAFEINISPVSGTKAPKTDTLQPTDDVYKFASENLIVAGGDYTYLFDYTSNGKTVADANAAYDKSVAEAKKAETINGKKTLYALSQAALAKVNGDVSADASTEAVTE